MFFFFYGWVTLVEVKEIKLDQTIPLYEKKIDLKIYIALIFFN